MTRAGPSDVVTSPERRAAYEAAGHWTADTLPASVAAHADRHGDRVAVVDLEGARSATYRQLEADASSLADHLVALGVRPRQVVSVQLPNWYEAVVADLAVVKVGAVLNPLLPIYRAKELRHVLSAAEVRVLICPDAYRDFDHADLAAELEASMPRLRTLTVPDPAVREREPFPDLLGTAPVRTSVAIDAADVSELIFTSGTEAVPKPVMHSEQTTNFSVRSAFESLGMSESDTVWMPSPIGHSTGLNFGVRMALHHGLPLVLQDRWSPEIAAALIERFRCSYTVAATTFLTDLIQHVQDSPANLESLRLFGSGGAPIPPQAVAAADERGIHVLRLYGSTEALVATWNRPSSPLDKRVGTDGRALDGVEVVVRDEHGQALIGEPGEILVRGPGTSLGLYDDPDRTRATYEADGWVRSGDLGTLDEDGYLTVVGRKKEIIIRGGLNIAPREIEDAIVQMPVVREVAVVGLPDPRLGETACACIVLDEGGRLTLEQLVDFLRERGMAAYKLPQRLAVVPALPKTSTGKVQKFALVDHLQTNRSHEPARSIIGGETVPNTCLAAVLEAYDEPLHLKELPIPTDLEPGSLLVAVETTTVCGSDVHLCTGRLTAMDVPLPVIPGHEFVGRVVKLGSGADRDSLGRELDVGDRIVWTHETCGACFACTVQRSPALCSNRRHYMFTRCTEPPYLMGGFAEYCYVFPKSGRLLVPDDVRSEWAAAGSCALRTVMQAFERLGRVRPWETVVIQGSGALGLFATAVAERAGAAKIVVVGAPAERLDVAKAYGADEVVSVDELDAPRRAERIVELTHGHGADIVMEFSGAPGAFKEGIDFLRRGGRYVVVGQVGESVDPITASLVTKKMATILGSWSGHTEHYWQALEFISRTSRDYDFDALISGRYSLQEASTAIDRARTMAEIKPAIYPGGVPA